MFVLRQTNKKSSECNHMLGDSYNFVSRETNPDEFRRTYKIHFEEDHKDDLDDVNSTYNSVNCHGFVVYNNGVDIYPLYKGFRYYVMTGDGKTFDNLTNK